MEQQQRQQLRQRLGLDQHVLECLMQQLPVHPCQWGMVATTCTELHDAVEGAREMLQRDICSAYGVSWMRARLIRKRLRSSILEDAGELLVELASVRQTAEAIRVLAAGAPADCRSEGRAANNWGELQCVIELHASEWVTGQLTPLLWAVALDDRELVEALIDAGAQLDLRNDEDQTALMCAVEQGKTDIAVALIDAGAQLDLRYELIDGGWTYAYGGWTCAYGGRTALMSASGKGNTELVEALIAAEAQLDVQDDSSWSALMHAAWEGHTQVAVALIAAGAKLYLLDTNGRTASDWASARGHTTIVQALLPRCDLCEDAPQKRCNGCDFTISILMQRNWVA